MLIIALVLFVLWVLAFGVFRIASALIHVLIILAVIALAWHLVANRPAATTAPHAATTVGPVHTAALTGLG
jgi:hypothetical protein